MSLFFTGSTISRRCAASFFTSARRASALSLAPQGVPSFALLHDSHPFMTTTYIAIPAMILYLAAGFKLGLRLAKGSQVSGSKFPFLVMGLIAVVLHTVVLYQNLFLVSGLNLGFFNALSLLSWLIAFLVLMAALFQPVENLGIAVLPLAALALSLEMAFPSIHVVSENLPATLRVHIAISMLSYSLFSIAAGQAILLAVQNRHHHNTRPGGFIRAQPPRETMEAQLFQMIAVAFVLQRLSLLSGILYIDDIFAQHLAHKTVLSIAAWLVYATLLIGRWRFGWRGRKAIRWTMGGGGARRGAGRGGGGGRGGRGRRGGGGGRADAGRRGAAAGAAR